MKSSTRADCFGSERVDALEQQTLPPSTFPHTDSMDVACSPGVDGQEVWQCQTGMDVGAVVALDAVSFGSALPHS